MAEFGVNLNFDDGGIADRLNKNADLFDKLAKEVKDLDTQMKYTGKSTVLELSKVQNETKGLISNFAKTGKAINDATLQTKKLATQSLLTQQSLDGVANAGKKGFGSIKDFVFGGLIAGGITGIIQSVVSLGKSIIDAGSNFEKTTKTFENAFGDQTLAKDYIALIQDFAAKTPFEFDKLTDSVLKLTNRGFTPTREELTKLGDLAATTGKDFDQLSEAILDAQTGEFERLKEFGIRAQKDGDTVTLAFRGQVKEIENTDEAIRNAIISYGELNGVQGAMAVQSKTFQGVMSNLKDTLTQISIKIFNAFGPALTQVIAFFSEKITYVYEVLQPVRDAFSNLFNTISGGTDTSKILNKVWDVMAYGINIVANTLTFLINGIDNTVKSFAKIANESTIITGAFNFVGNTIAFLSQKIQELPAFLGATGAAISQFFKNIKSLNFDIGVADTYEKEFAKLTKVRVDNEKENKASFERDEKTEKEILDRRSKNKTAGIKKEGEEIKKALKEYTDALSKINNEAQGAKRSNQIDAIDNSTIQGQIERLQLQQQFDREDLEERKRVTLEKVKDAEQRTNLTEAFKALEVELSAKYNKELIDLERKSRDEYKKAIEDSAKETNEIIKKNKIDEANARLEGNLRSIQLSEDLQLASIDRELKYGELSLNQRKELERQKLEIILASLQAQRGAFGLTVNEETIKLDSLIKDAQAGLKAFDEQAKPAFKNAGDLFKTYLQDAFNIDDEQFAALSDGFGALKDSILSVVNAGYEAEINALDESIKTREDRISDLEGLIESELDAKNKGYANDYDALLLQKTEEETLLKEDNKKRIEIQKEQLRNETAIQAAQQVGALVTAVANMVASGSKLGIFGLPIIAASVIGLFALYKNYKNQVKALSVSAFKGGKISDYLQPGQTAKSDRPGYGEGHRVEGTNLRIGADEFLVNAVTTSKHLPFLNEFNKGSFDNIDFMKAINKAPDKSVLVKVVREKEQRDKASVVNGLDKESLKEVIREQTNEILDMERKKPIVINLPNGDVEVTYITKNGVNTRVVKKG
jgi:hypothetical protein